MAELVTELTSQIATAAPVIVGVIGAIIGLVFIVVLGRFIIARVRGSVK